MSWKKQKEEQHNLAKQVKKSDNMNQESPYFLNKLKDSMEFLRRRTVKLQT